MFAHSQSELQVLPDLAKTSLCQAFLQGHCPLPSHQCQFAHGRNELRRTAAFQRKSKDSRKSEGIVEAAFLKASADDASLWDGSMSTTSEVRSGSTTPTTQEAEEAWEEAAPSGTVSPMTQEANEACEEEESVRDEEEGPADICGFESEDEFESPWTSEATSVPLSQQVSPVQFMMPMAAPVQLASDGSPLACDSKQQMAFPTPAGSMLNCYGSYAMNGNFQAGMAPWAPTMDGMSNGQCNVAFIPVMMVPAPAAAGAPAMP